MKRQSILFIITVWLILIINLSYVTSSIFITTELFDTKSVFTITNFIAYLVAIVLLVENGTLIRSRLFYFMLISIMCIITGFLFKVQHWPQALEILVLGLSLCLCVYLVHFFRKSNHFTLDYLKLVWVVLYVTFSLDNILHIYFLREWIAIRDLAFLAMLAYYAYIFTIRKSMPNSTE